MGGVSPRICAGHDISCPYEETASTRRMGDILPSIRAGRSMLRPYEEKPEEVSQRRLTRADERHIVLRRATIRVAHSR
jgi:hypothetical protein